MKRILIINIILIILICIIPNKNITKISQAGNIVEITDNIEIADTETIIEHSIETEDITSRSAEIRAENIIENTVIETEDKSLEGYRITSYYPAENNNTTGSGKTTNDFNFMNINGKKVYSYQGRIVVAAATNELLKTGYNQNGSQNKQKKHYFNYYDTGRMKIENNWYGFIVLDSCGAAMWNGYYRLDIFVPNSENIIDTKNVEIVYD